ncbi:GDSL-type esterase/lipase family protein [Spirillospora sp. CA-294931]|uniref:GDSL-type esterase/lipase family protein n=1 Tax=Spirillospora sp. CA-294931 TaxID=3240042 RepID=UPI003D92C493
MKGRRLGRSLVVLAVAGVVVQPVGASAEAEPVPGRMAALGDSITRAFNVCGWFSDCVRYSWSTGTEASVRSHYVRLRAKNPALVAYNDAVSGAKVADLERQAGSAVSRDAQYVTVLVGANDACTSSEGAMTTVADYEARLRAGMKALGASRKVFLGSVPDIYRLWEIGKDSSAARSRWSFGICQSMLARPTSTDPADEARRQRVRQRVIDYNGVLAKVCAEYAGCRFDGNALFNYRFVLSELSAWDYFHPNAKAQTELAARSYALSFWPDV